MKTHDNFSSTLRIMSKVYYGHLLLLLNIWKAYIEAALPSPATHHLGCHATFQNIVSRVYAFALFCVSYIYKTQIHRHMFVSVVFVKYTHAHPLIVVLLNISPLAHVHTYV